VKSRRLTIAFLLLSLAGAGNVMADRGHYPHHRPHFGVFIGPYWDPWYYPPYYYYPPYGPPLVVEQAPPTVYIEQEGAPSESTTPATPAQTNYWYYCEAQRAYFPYVQECPGGWQKVLPQPPAPN
jgi:hypothetical protein